MGRRVSKMSKNINGVKNTLKKKNNRQKMRDSNRLAVRVLLDAGFDDIWLKPHTKFTDYVYSKNGNYYAMDLWGMWDGIARKNDKVVFLALKTNKWDSDNKIKLWMSKVSGVEAIAINVKNKRVDLRYYGSPSNSYSIISDPMISLPTSPN